MAEGTLDGLPPQLGGRESMHLDLEVGRGASGSKFNIDGRLLGSDDEASQSGIQLELVHFKDEPHLRAPQTHDRQLFDSRESRDAGSQPNNWS